MEILKKIENHSLKIAILGMGYVGLPLAIEFSQKFKVIGFDINKEKIEQYKNLNDPIGDFEEELKKSKIYFTDDEKDLKNIDIFIITVQTPITKENLPDLKNIKEALKIVGRNINKQSLVIIESTVYPGVTEEYGIKILEEYGLKSKKDFFLGYSPERINPGDKEHKVKNTSKIVAGIDLETTEIMEKLYGSIIEKNIYRAPNIKTAEAAKVIENIQRDINIALVNELAIIFNKMNIDTKEVLKAADTKWNFAKYTPGLVGGHCIGVDPYYLVHKAKEVGIYPKMILAGREINDYMGKYIAKIVVKKLIKNNIILKNAKVAILGVAFKENCSDARNSKVIDIVKELNEYDIYPKIYDPIVNKKIVEKEYGIKLENIENIKKINVIILAVPHKKIMDKEKEFQKMYDGEKKIIIDIKRVLDKEKYLQLNFDYWGL